MDYQIGYKLHVYEDPTIKAKFFGFVEHDRKRYAGFSKSIMKMAPEFARYAMLASREALDMAFGDDKKLAELVSPFDIGVIIGTGWGGADAVIASGEDYRESGTTSSFATVTTMNSVATAAVSMNWNLRGYQNTPIAACATGTMAIGDAYEIIKSGRQKVMLAGGSESLKDRVNVWSIDVTQALSKEVEQVELACCPFDAKRSGFILSDGAAIVCLEEMEHALARGATILGEVSGYANYSDAYDMTAPAEDMKARQYAIEHALRDAGCEPHQIDYINLHGTSTQKNDVNETNSIKFALGEAAYSIPMSSTKSYTGHLIGAAGALESIFCLKAIGSGVIPATINLRHPDPECDLNYTPNQHSRGHTIHTALNLSFGFGGANCAAVFKRFVQ